MRKKNHQRKEHPFPTSRPDAVGFAYPKIVVPHGAVKNEREIGEVLLKALSKLREHMERKGVSDGDLNARRTKTIPPLPFRPDVIKFGVAYDTILTEIFRLGSRGRPRTLGDRDQRIWEMREQGKTFGQIAATIETQTAQVKAAYYRERKRRSGAAQRSTRIFETIKEKLRPFNIHFQQKNGGADSL